MTLDQVKAARPALDYEGRYGSDTGAVDDGDVHRGDLQGPVAAGAGVATRRAMSQPHVGSGLRRRPWLPLARHCRGGRVTFALVRRVGAARRGRRGPPLTPRQARADRSHRHLGGGGHRGLALAHGRRRRRATSASIPVNGEGRKAAQAWNLEADNAGGNQCKAFGVGGIMRQPGRLRISWQDDATLKLEFDAGTQTRLLTFDRARAAAGREDVAGILARRVGRPRHRPRSRGAARARCRACRSAGPGRRRSGPARRPAAARTRGASSAAARSRW